MIQPVDLKKVDTWRRKIGVEFESKAELLIPILQFVQSLEGYLPPEAMEATARFLKLPSSKIYGVASFYAQFNFTPQGKNKLTVCRGTACHVRGSGPLLTEVQRELGVVPGQTTEDMSFTLETVACFGACALAPVVVLNDTVLRKQTVPSIKGIVQQARTESATSGKRRGKSEKVKKKSSSSSKRKKNAPGTARGKKSSSSTL